MRTYFLCSISLLFLVSVKAQWTDSGSSLTTTDNVGIGVANPNSNLTVKSSSNSNPIMNIISLPPSGNTADNIFQIKQSNEGDGWIQLGDRYTNSGEPNNVRLHSRGESWLNGGNVGIGTTNPVNRFHVKGNTLGTVAEDQSIITTIEGSVDGNNSKFQILNKRNSNGPNWNNSSLRLQRVVDATPQAFIDFGIDGNNSSYGLAFGTRNGFGGTQQTRMVIEENGYVGIGTSSPDSKLAVNGNIHAKEVKVDLVGWPDFVFEKEYDLPTLQQVESHIKENGHLKDIPNAKEVQENGVLLGEMEARLLQKIEELTLYTIQQQKEIQSLQQENEELKSLFERVTKVEELLELKR